MIATRWVKAGMVILLAGVFVFSGALVGVAQDQEYTGYMGDDVEDDYYPIYVQEGQTVTVSATAISGDLDTYILLMDVAGNVLIENDDRDSTTYDSYFSYTVETSGQYHVVMSNIQDTRGEYRLTISLTGSGGSAEEQPGAPGSVFEADEIFSGFMGDNVSDATHVIRLEAGQALVAAMEATSGNLDAYLLLLNENDQEVAYNDDRDETTLDSEIVYVAAETGDYTLIVSNLPATSGNYRLTISIVPGDQVTPRTRVEMSGPVLTSDTPNFRVHYTLEGTDATTEDFAKLVAATLEEVWDIQINEMGWPEPPVDGLRGGDERYDVYVVELLDEIEGGDLGYTMPEGSVYGSDISGLPSYIVLDRAYADEEILEGRTPKSLMRATVAHEFNHAVQFGYSFTEPHGWYYEATATWMETSTFPADQDAVGYIDLVFEYPEICLGVDGDADPSGGSMMYGEWLFIQTLVDAHGLEIPIRLWENIADYDGWDALEVTLSAYGDTIPEAAVRYHLQNLLRDYELAPLFRDKTVWLEKVVDRPGEWTGNPGVQQLGANFFELALMPGVYGVQLKGAELELWGIGISGDTADIFELGIAGTVDTSGYDVFYVMIFYPEPASDVLSCGYRTFSLNVQPAEGTPVQVLWQMDASQFITLE